MSDTTTTTDATTTDTTTTATTDAAKTYTPPATQEELERILNSAVARTHKKYEDYDDLKKKAEAHDAYVESQKTETQKQIDAARGETSTEVTQKFLTRIVSAEVKATAGALGFNDPADALQVLDPKSLPVKDDEPDADAIKALVAKLATDKPYLLKDAPKVVKPTTRPKPADGEKPDKDIHEGKGRAAAALRQLGVSLKSG